MESRWLHPETRKEQRAEAEASAEVLEPHAVLRGCGHEETLQVGRPWGYVDRVAALIPCAACRRKGMQGPIAMGGDGL